MSMAFVWASPPASRRRPPRNADPRSQPGSTKPRSWSTPATICCTTRRSGGSRERREALSSARRAEPQAGSRAPVVAEQYAGGAERDAGEQQQVGGRAEVHANLRSNELRSVVSTTRAATAAARR